jgi:flagellar FliL protein
MADETEEQAAEEAVPEVIADEPASDGKKKWILVGAALLALAGGGAGLVFLQGEPEQTAQSGPSPDQVAEKQEKRGVVDGVDYAAELEIDIPDDIDVASGDEEAPAAPAPGHMGTIVNLEPFVVNISDKERDRFLKLKADIELSEDGVAAEFEQRLPQIRDLIISLLGGKSFEDLRTIEGKNFLREEILLRVNALLVTGKAKRVFFTEFVVQ